MILAAIQPAAPSAAQPVPPTPPPDPLADLRDISPPVDVLVRYASGAYITATLRGQRCSSTHSAEQAALGLARKLWPAAAGHQVAQVAAEGLRVGETVWRLGPA